MSSEICGILPIRQFLILQYFFPVFLRVNANVGTVMFVYNSWQLEHGKVVACFPAEDGEVCITSTDKQTKQRSSIVDSVYSHRKNLTLS